MIPKKRNRYFPFKFTVGEIIGKGAMALLTNALACRGWDRNTQPSACKAILNSNRLRHRRRSLIAVFL